MKRVYTQGEMPSQIKAFAKQLSGQLSGQKETEFWEMSNITEFEKKATEIGYEIIPTVDMSTDRAFLSGFDVEESNVLLPGGHVYAQLKMYFVEVSIGEFNAWVKKIKEHRDEQQKDYFNRKEDKIQRTKQKIKIKEIIDERQRK